MAYVPSFKSLAQYLDHFAHNLSSNDITPPPPLFILFKRTCEFFVKLGKSNP